MRCTWKRWGIIALAMWLAMLSGGVAFGQGKGGGKPPKDDPPPPPPPPVNYLITRIGNMGGINGLNCFAVNQSGVMVGGGYNAAQQQAAWVYVPGAGGTGQPVDLNGLAAPGGELPAGWTAGWARDVNEMNQIVGTAYDQSGNNAVFVCELDLGEFVLFPSFSNNDRGFGINNYGTVVFADINGNIYRQEADVTAPSWTPLGTPTSWSLDGTVVGHGKINDQGVIVAAADGTYRYDPNLEQWSLLSATVAFYEGNLNQAGSFAASERVSRRERNAVRYTHGVGFETLYTSKSGAPQGVGINSSGDVVLYGASSWDPFLFMDDYGLISLDATVVGDPADVADFQAGALVRQIFNRDASGFGAICAIMENSDTGLLEVVLLTPVP